MNRHLLIVIAIFAAINIILFIVSATQTAGSIIDFFAQFNANNIRTYVLSFGAFAPVIFILLQILQTVIAPIPGGILTIAGGLIWGTFLGALFSVIGAFIGANLCFQLSRHLGRPFVEKFAKKDDIEFVDFVFQKYGFWAIIILRLIPLMAFDVISYGAGLTKMDFRKYAAATLIGMVPSTLFYTYIGFTLADSNTLVVFVLTIAVLVVFFFMGTIKNFLMKRLPR